MMVRFGTGSIVQATYLSGSQITLLTPAAPVLSPTVVAVECSTNGQDFTSFDYQFVFNANVSILSLDPAQGPLSGGTVVSVYGTGFIDSSMLACSVGSVSSDVVAYKNSTLLTCETPQFNDTGPFPLEISTNNKDFSSSGINFTYYDDPTVSSVSPTLGPMQGGTVVDVVGSSFLDIPTMQCRFNRTVVDATFVSSTLVRCTTPTLNSSGTFLVSTTTNGRHWTSNSVEFFHHGG
jgi:hypothetical protein